MEEETFEDSSMEENLQNPEMVFEFIHLCMQHVCKIERLCCAYLMWVGEDEEKRLVWLEVERLKPRGV